MLRIDRKSVRTVVLVTACVFAGSLFLPVGMASAAQPTSAPPGGSSLGALTTQPSQPTDREQEQELAEELEFIFEKASSTDAVGNITVDYASLENRYGNEAPNLVFFIYASQGKSFDEAIAALPANVSPPRIPAAGSSEMSLRTAYTDCILDKSGFASIAALFSGAMAGYLAAGSYDMAGKLIFNAALKTGLKVTIPGIVVTLGASATWCAFTT